MSFAVYLVVLAIGGMVIGALSAMLMPRARTGGVPAGAVFGLAFTVIAGIWITEFFETQTTVGLPVALALALLFHICAPLSSGGGGGSWGHWSVGDSGGSADCGGGDGGGGDGGGGGGGGD